jgi:hypothetical protein
MEDGRNERILRYAAVFFLVGFAVHNADHIRRGASSVTTELFVAGTLAGAVSVAAVVAVLVRHRLAPQIAVATGFPLAVGFFAAHMLPTWSVLSDSFVEGGASAFSLFASSLEIVSAVTFGIAGLVVLRRRRVSGATSVSAVPAPPAQVGGVV